jgi:RNA polymerase sigma-70 factor (sigma-E family)
METDTEAGPAPDAVPAGRPPDGLPAPHEPDRATLGSDQVPGGAVPGPHALAGQHDSGEQLPVQLAPNQQPVAVLEELLIARGERLLRAAIMLAGGRDDGEDLLQAALERVYRHWRHIEGDPEGYLRRTLYHLAADGWRRRGLLRTRLRLLRQPAWQPDETSAIDQRDELVRLLRALPPRQRTAVVLRYWEELGEAETARLMGCSVGNVKSSASRGLRKLRELSGDTSDQPGTTAIGSTLPSTAQSPASDTGEAS